MTISLMCVPFAGAGAGTFRQWQGAELKNVNVVPVQLPGREELFGLAPCSTMAEDSAMIAWPARTITACVTASVSGR